MNNSATPAVVGVRFSKVGKIYHFGSNRIPDLRVGDKVVVETARGWQLGEIVQFVSPEEANGDNLKQIDRKATPPDLIQSQVCQQREPDVLAAGKARAIELRLELKVVNAEYSYDGSRLTIFFSTETEEKVDLKSLRQDMQKVFAPAQVELRQIGPRDVAKIICGMGACGLETRCCCKFLTDFSSISIRMAKEQGISLTPTEITGMCGRLRCCLIYEYQQYVDARQQLPKRNKRVMTPNGEGRVVDVIPLQAKVLVEIPDLGVREFARDEITLVDEQKPDTSKPAGG